MTKVECKTAMPVNDHGLTVWKSAWKPDTVKWWNSVDEGDGEARGTREDGKKRQAGSKLRFLWQSFVVRSVAKFIHRVHRKLIYSGFIYIYISKWLVDPRTSFYISNPWKSIPALILITRWTITAIVTILHFRSTSSLSIYSFQHLERIERIISFIFVPWTYKTFIELFIQLVDEADM